MDLSLIPGVYAVAGVAFLAFCVRENRRTGFRRDRSEVSILQEGLLWIDEVNAALSEAPQEQRPIDVPAPAPPVDGLKETLAAAQLMNLGYALTKGSSSVPVTVTNNPTTTHSEAQAEFEDHDHLSELAAERNPLSQQ